MALKHMSSGPSLLEHISGLKHGQHHEHRGVTTERMPAGHYITHVTGQGGVKLSRSPQAAAKHHEWLANQWAHPSTKPVPGREPKQRR